MRNAPLQRTRRYADRPLAVTRVVYVIKSLPFFGVDGSTEFLFIFRVREQAQGASDELSALGYAVRVVAGDGEGHLFQLRLTLDRALRRHEGEALFSDVLAPVMQRHRGSYQGTSRHLENYPHDFDPQAFLDEVD